MFPAHFFVTPAKVGVQFFVKNKKLNWIPACAGMTVFLFIVLLSAKVFADNTTIVITKPACEWLVKHKPFSDVEYKPGVDVMGRSVAPADVPGPPPVKLPDDITIDIKSALSVWMPVISPARAITTGHTRLRDEIDDSDVELGKIVLKGDQLSYNGQPLTDPQQEDLALRCADLK